MLTMNTEALAWTLFCDVYKERAVKRCADMGKDVSYWRIPKAWGCLQDKVLDSVRCVGATFADYVDALFLFYTPSRSVKVFNLVYPPLTCFVSPFARARYREHKMDMDTRMAVDVKKEPWRMKRMIESQVKNADFSTDYSTALAVMSGRLTTPGIAYAAHKGLCSYGNALSAFRILCDTSGFKDVDEKAAFERATKKMGELFGITHFKQD